MMNTFDKTLKKLLYRLECPSKMDLGEYEIGMLDLFRSEAISEHISSCQLCQADLAQLRQFMSTPVYEMFPAGASGTESLSLLEKIKIIVIDLLSPPEGVLVPTAVQPAMRGADDDIATRLFHVDPYIISLSAIRDSYGQRKQNIIGDIIPTSDEEVSFHQWTTFLWRDGELLGTSRVDEDSNFYFEDVAIENHLHDLVLSGPSIEIHLQNLRMH
jgi:hypothetical protein